MQMTAQATANEWHREPGLEEVLADPIVHLVMRRDKLETGDVRPLLQDVRTRLLRRRAGGCH